MRLLFPFLTSFILAGTAEQSLAADPLRRVFVANAPLAHFVDTLSGGSIEVVYPVPQGIDPAFWNPTPEDVLAAQGADIILLNGAGYSSWAKSAVLPRGRIVVSAAAFKDRLIADDGPKHQHGPEGAHSDGAGMAFTTWLDPELAMLQLEATAQALIEKWPDLAAGVDTARANIESEIAEMDTAFERFFARTEGRQIITSHPVYQYLERRYGQSPVPLHWEPDVMPDQREWSRFEALLESAKSPLLIWEGEPDPEIADNLDRMGVDWLVISPFANASNRTSLFSQIAAQVSAAE